MDDRMFPFFPGNPLAKKRKGMLWVCSLWCEYLRSTALSDVAPIKQKIIIIAMIKKYKYINLGKAVKRPYSTPHPIIQSREEKFSQ